MEFILNTEDNRAAHHTQREDRDDCRFRVCLWTLLGFIKGEILHAEP